MLGIAIAHALAEAGFGKVDKNIICEWQVPEMTGDWPYGTLFVNTTTIGADNGILTDRVTLTPIASDQAEQTLILLRLLHWVDKLAQTGTLTCGPECDVRFRLTDVPDKRTITNDARLRSGRWVKSLNFNVSYRLPDLPGAETANRIKGADAQSRATPPDNGSTLVDVSRFTFPSA